MLHIKNYMEEIVFHQMEEVLADINVCKCEKCRLDIAAIALNDLPPKYIVTEKGELYTKADTLIQQFEVDIIAAIAKAAVIVKRRPRHGRLCENSGRRKNFARQGGESCK